MKWSFLVSPYRTYETVKLLAFSKINEISVYSIRLNHGQTGRSCMYR